MDFKLNINEYVKVKLNDLGLSILKARRDELNKMIHANGGKGLGEFELKVDEEGYTKFPLWELMNTFGHVMVMGFDVPFETDIIVTKGEPISESKVKFLKEIDVVLQDEELEEDEKAASFSVCECMECHWKFIGDCERHGYGFTSQGVQIPDYCPMCGTKIVEVLED